MTDKQETPVWGVPSIAKIVGKSPTAVRHMIRQGQLPARKIGGKFCAFPSELHAALRGEEVQ